MALFHEAKYEQAAASYRQAIEHHKDFSEAQNGLGASLLPLARETKQSRPSAPQSPAIPKMQMRSGILVPHCLPQISQRKLCPSFAKRTRCAQIRSITFHKPTCRY
jgi:hypothetical protein